MTDPRAAALAPIEPASVPDEPRDHRLRRLRMRSWRRGMREMDLLLGPYADAGIEALAPADLAQYEALLPENDQDLYLWLTKGRDVPDRHRQALSRIAAFHGIGDRASDA